MHQHRQIHVWITESDYLLLREQAVVTRESVSAVIRRLIKSERQRLRVTPVPPAIEPAVPVIDSPEMFEPEPATCNL